MKASGSSSRGAKNECARGKRNRTAGDVPAARASNAGGQGGVDDKSICSPTSTQAQARSSRSNALRLARICLSREEFSEWLLATWVESLKEALP